MVSTIAKKLVISLTVAVVTLLAACNSKSPEYKELEKSGKVHDAQIIAIDSVKGECTYHFFLCGKHGENMEYKGTCKQRDDNRFVKDQLILIVYLERDPSINRRLSDK